MSERNPNESIPEEGGENSENFSPPANLPENPPDAAAAARAETAQRLAAEGQANRERAAAHDQAHTAAGHEGGGHGGHGGHGGIMNSAPVRGFWGVIGVIGTWIGDMLKGIPGAWGKGGGSGGHAPAKKSGGDHGHGGGGHH